jgi:hypothetical protein
MSLKKGQASCDRLSKLNVVKYSEIFLLVKVMLLKLVARWFIDLINYLNFFKNIFLASVAD